VAGELDTPPLGRWAKGRQRIAVVGGGQTGAECVVFLIRMGVPDVQWHTRTPWFCAMDDGPGANAIYTEGYAEQFQVLPPGERQTLVRHQKVTSDGVSMVTLREIYRLKLLGAAMDNFQLGLHAGSEVVGSQLGPTRAAVLLVRDPNRGGAAPPDYVEAEGVVVACGRRPTTPFTTDAADEGAGIPPILTTGIDVERYGIQEKNLSLLGWRSRRVLAKMGVELEIPGAVRSLLLDAVDA